MLNIKEIKKLLERPDMLDKEAEVIRDTCQGLVELTFDLVKKEKFRIDNSELFAERK